MKSVVLLLLAAALGGLPAAADGTQDWLDGKIAPEPRTGPPLFSDAEWQALRDGYPYEYRFVTRNGIPTPTLNGRFLMGVEYRYAPNSLAQCDYDTRLLAAAGINVARSAMRSIPEEGGDAARVAVWKSKDELLRKRGIAVMLEPGGMHYSGDILRDLYENVLRRPMPEAFTRWRGVFGAGARYGDFFNPEYRVAHGQVLAELMRALGPASTVGYIYSDEPELHGVGPKTEAADADWRAFLKRFYGDRAPGEDTNGDGATFNAFFKKQCASWEEVPPFTKEEHDRSNAASALVGVWMRWGHARFIDALSAECRKVLPEATVSEAYIGGSQVSLLNAMPHNRFIGYGNYGKIAQTAYYTGAAHAYNKPGYTFHINRGHSNYWGARHIGVASLPFTAAQMWWHLTTGCNDAVPQDYGRHYSLANWWEVNDHSPKAWGGKVNRIVEYDSRFLIIPQIAPFLGRFDSMPAELANGVLWIDPPVVDLVRNNHVVTEEALVLGEQKIDLDRYRLVIFLKRGPARFAETHAILRDYVQRGGTVLVNVNEVGAGETLFGQPNARAWLAPYKPGRRKPRVLTTAGSVLYEDRFHDTARWQRERFSHEGPCSLVSPHTPGHVGAYPDGATGSFVYRFPIPEEYTHFRISDTHYVWGRQNKVQMWISGDNRTWKLQHDDAPQDVSAYTWSKVFSVAQDLDGKRELYVRYSFKAGDPSRAPTDNRGAALKFFKLEGLTGEDVAELAAWQGDLSTTARLGDLTCRADLLEAFVLPGEGMLSDGRVTDGKGAERPLVILRPEGKGRWIVWNSPAMVPAVARGAREFNAATWTAQWKLLDAVIRKHTQGRIEEYDQPYVAQGEGCLMAATWEGASAAKEHVVSFRTPYPRAVVYEVLDGVSEGGAFLPAQAGSGRFTKDLSQGGHAAHLWVIKPFGRPILLCADGTVKHVMKIGDGILAGGRLSFEMAERAAVSAPTPPKTVTHNGRKAPVEYDPATQIARIRGTGSPGTCTVEF